MGMKGLSGWELAERETTVSEPMKEIGEKVESPEKVQETTWMEEHD